MADLYTPTGNPENNKRAYASLIRQEFELIQAGLNKLRMIQTVYLADANVPSDRLVVVPRAAALEKLFGVIEAANGSGTTNVTAYLNDLAISNATLSVQSTDTLGTVVSRIPAADNVAAEGDVLKLSSDGGGTGVMPMTVTLVWAYE